MSGAVVELLAREAGLACRGARRSHVEATIRKAMERARCATEEEYLAQLDARPALLRSLIDDVVVSETYFFRDQAQLDVVRAFLGGCERRDSPPLRAWSAGCSSGEEAYSLAMLFDELGLLDRVSILAGDVSTTALVRARQAVYGSWSFRNLSPAEYPQWFIPRGERWTVAKRLRDAVTFVDQNLAHCALLPPLAEFDVILCRNVMLYFDRATIERVVRYFAASLRPGGWLVTSAADPLLAAEPGLEPLVTNAGIVYRKELALPPAVAEVLPSLPKPAPAFLAPPMPSPAPLAPAEPMPALAAPAAVEDANDLDPQAHVGRALAFLDRGRVEEAAASARQALYLDRSIAVAHFALARALRIMGDYDGARRSLRRLGALISEVPPDAPVRCASHLSAGSLAHSAGAEHVLLERSAGGGR